MAMASGNSKHPRQTRRLLLNLGLVCLGFLLLAWGASYLALAALGQERTGVIDYSVRRYGASRGTVYTVYYQFQVPGQGEYHGSASTGAGHPPAGRLSIRYLSFWPGINHPGSTGLLLFYSAAFLVPGVLLAGFNARSLGRRCLSAKLRYCSQS